MFTISLDLVEVLSCAVAGMVLGALWYGPIAFGNVWMKSLGKTKATLGSATGPMIGSIFASLLTAIGVSILSSAVGIASPTQALSLGFVLGILVIFPALLSDNLFCGWGRSLLLIQSGYRILAVILMALIAYFV